MSKQQGITQEALFIAEDGLTIYLGESILPEWKPCVIVIIYPADWLPEGLFFCFTFHSVICSPCFMTLPSISNTTFYLPVLLTSMNLVE